MTKAVLTLQTLHANYFAPFPEILSASFTFLPYYKLSMLCAHLHLDAAVYAQATLPFPHTYVYVNQGLPVLIM